MPIDRLARAAAAIRRTTMATAPKDWAMVVASVAFVLLVLGPLAGAIAAVLAPGILVFAGGIRTATRAASPGPSARDSATGLPMRQSAVDTLEQDLAGAAQSGRLPACLVVSIDEAHEFATRAGHVAYEAMLRKSGERILGALRECDLLVRLEGPRFGVALAPSRRTDLETLIQVAARIQNAVCEPLSIDAASIYVTASVGFCLARRAPAPGGIALFSAAETAADEADRCGPSAIKSYTVEFEQALSRKAELRDDIEQALENGQIVAHFQPQLSTDTGEVSGFEALARWEHPTRGTIPPAEFLPALHAAGLSARLAETVLHAALSALKSWEGAGFRVPTVAVNFSRNELEDPGLPERLQWELDRFDLAPSRLTVEILESVVTDTDADLVVRNVAALARLGCHIDLDDFGTGHASIASMRRFSVDRIKIDRSFVTRVDCDQKQRQMISAILSMAERLDIKTLAEGVETIGEHAILSQLGCTHVQGYAIARPMPLADTMVWLERHRGKLLATPRLTRRIG